MNEAKHVNPDGIMVTCVVCKARATFTRDALCDHCRPRTTSTKKKAGVDLFWTDEDDR